jgi:predicted acyltransferase
MESPPPRSAALDALRGLAVLLMCLSGVVPFGVLPPWMYHAQEPPPEHHFRPDVPGITWVDLVFPWFLFAMGAAIPLALGPRLARGEPVRGLALAALRRGLVLAGFALFAQAVQPWLMSASPGPREWWLALLGFALATPVLARLPTRWSAQTRVVVRVGGVLASALLLASLRYADGGGFRLERVDIILLVLANVVVTGSWIWLATRSRPAARAAVLLVVALLFAGVRHLGWGDALPASPAPWLARLEFQKYLLVVLPGTFAGEVLARAGAARAAEPRSSPARALVAAALLLLAVCGTTAALFARDVAAASCAAVLPALAAERLLARDPGGAHRLVVLALPLVAAGVALDPLEGGIRKDAANLSYLATTAVLSGFALAALALAERVPAVRRALSPCADVGRNPMLAYLAIRNVLAPVWALSGAGPALVRVLDTPWLGALHAAIKTATLGLFASFCTRLGLVWRS